MARKKDTTTLGFANDNAPRESDMSAAVEAAFAVAEQAHKGQRYGDEPYTTHLREVLAIAVDFWPFEEAPPEHVQVAAVLHDVIEDTAYDPREMLHQFGPDATRIVLLVTDPEHGTRAERKAHVLRLLRGDREAAYAKLSDRLANVRRIDNPKRLRMYEREQETFVKPLVEAHPEMLRGLYEEIQRVIDLKRGTIV